LNSSRYDAILNDQVNPWPTDDVDEAGYDQAHPSSEAQPEHPCLALKKLLSSGTFFYSADFDLTRRLQKRYAKISQDNWSNFIDNDSVADNEPTIAIDSLDGGFLWNSYMIQPLVDFRSGLSPRERASIDSSRILTSAIRGYCHTTIVPFSSAPLRSGASGLPSSMTIISRLSCKRAGTRFNARGIDDDGNVANFVQTETVFWNPIGICFSYVQVRGSVPIFWEQATGLVPGQQKISITRSEEATQPAFDKHFKNLERSYGATHVINLLSAEKPVELDLTRRYEYHIARSPLNDSEKGHEHHLISETQFDFHAETKGQNYEAASMIKYRIQNSADSFGYFLSEDIEETKRDGSVIRRTIPILQQEGIFRTNCLDCLDRTNLIQGIISRMALESFFSQRDESVTADFWARHSTLWADNGDTLSRIYAGTGALKSSFTRHGKTSLGGLLSDFRKSTTRFVVNNFVDKGRQVTIDMLLGRLVGQPAVTLYDPVNDFVQSELQRRAGEFTSIKDIHILVGTFNVNGKDRGLREDLASWLCPNVDESQRNPEIVAIGFQEIVELSPQQIMSTDPFRRQEWERVVKNTLNDNAEKYHEEEYVLLRGGQLVGASLSIFVRTSMLPYIKNVEGSIKKTGLSGMAGNKGAVAIRMEYGNTSLCFVTAHLAAGFANYDERNRDYRTIVDGLRFQRNRSIDDHESVIWLGDFNYRIGLSNERARQLLKDGDMETLYLNDQLNIQMTHGQVFRFYSEAPITFPPTYKFDNGTDNYDTSEKSRVPAWTDRVLRKGDNLRQINYNIASLRFSDHRPVYATFLCEISIINENVRDALQAKLYSQRKAAFISGVSSGTLIEPDELDEEYEALPSKGLPPPSSSKQKWWLDNGARARSTAEPPAQGYEPSAMRPANPFGVLGTTAASDEPEWVKVETSNVPPPPPPPRRSGASRNGGSLPRVASGIRNALTPPPPKEEPLPTLVHRRQLPSESDYLDMKKAQARERQSLAQDPRILPPPSKLALGMSESPANLVTRRIPHPPPQMQNQQQQQQQQPSPNSAVGAPPRASPTATVVKGKAPPPRPKKPSTLVSTPVSPVQEKQGKVDLMDERDEGMDGLRDWEILKPVY
jgi:endonuclease/exonuclease/phosphatase family metal-dependent hydrolase